jgi:type IV pilus assembly protein PilY1
MKKIKLFIIQILLFACLIISNSFSKALPPGSGDGDVPANILILLDKSASMNSYKYTGVRIPALYGFEPIPGTGKYIYRNEWDFGGFDDATSELAPIVQTNSQYQFKNNSCSTFSNPLTGSFNILYHNNHIYFDGMPNGQDQPATVCKVNTTTGTTTSVIKNIYPPLSIKSLKKHNDIIILVNKTSRKIYLHNSATNKTVTCSPSGMLQRVLSGVSDFKNKVVFDIDASGNLVFIYHYGSESKIYKFRLNGMGCPNNNPSYTVNLKDKIRLDGSKSMVAHPTNDKIIYLLRSSQVEKITLGTRDSTTKQEAGTRAGLANWASYKPTPVFFDSASEIKIDPVLNRIFVSDDSIKDYRGVIFKKVESFDLDLNYVNSSGYPKTDGITIMDGAIEAIQSLVTDSSLLSSVNFGFGYWSSSGGYYVTGSEYMVKFQQSDKGWVMKPCYHFGAGFFDPPVHNYWTQTFPGRLPPLYQDKFWCHYTYPDYNTLGYAEWAGNEAKPCDNYNCLKVRVDTNGASEINKLMKDGIMGTGSTDALIWGKMADDYYRHPTDSPIDTNSPCQSSYVVVIGDGAMDNVSKTKTIVENLLNQKKVKTFTIAYGGGIDPSGIVSFDQLAKAGGTDRTIIANTPDELKAQLNAAVRSVISQKLSFSAPAITATLEQSGSLLQAQFKYKQNMEWEGVITRTAISKDGEIDENDSGNWDASQMMPEPSARKIWGIIPGTDYKTDYNNFTESNSILINSQFELFGNRVGDYHRDSPKVSGVTGNTRCSSLGDSSSTIADGIDDDIKGLISFSRGEDYFDYDGDCNLNETRKAYLGDVYHSEMVVVGAPSADTTYNSKNQEAYWRSIKGYDTWAKSLSGRSERIYVGGNDGMLHSFDNKTGQEKWAFIPPFIMSKMPLMVNTTLNNELANVKGGSNAIFGVDGSPVVHDMYFKSALDSSEKWHTILMVPYGRGGNGFTVLDITDPDKPLHLYSVYNDHIKNKVFVMNHLNMVSQYQYIDDTYSIIDMEETILVTNNYNNNNQIDIQCKADTTTSCYESRTWTFPVSGVTKADLEVNINNKNITDFTVQTGSSGRPKITFPQKLFFQANPIGTNSVDTLVIKLKGTFSSSLPAEYDYKELGETWSAPRIFRLPNTGAGDSNIEDDIYVAVMGGGYGGRNEGVGSALFVINLEDSATPGKVEKVIQVADDKNLNIINSITGTPVVVTSDTTSEVKFKGALVYTNDFEGKVTKYNLTNMDNDGSGGTINLYDHTTLLSIGASKENGRYQYHAMDAGIGTTSNHLWLFSGTGDYERINYRDSSLDNIMYGFRDEDFPLYKKKDYNETLFGQLSKCSDTTNDATGAKCPLTTNSSPKKNKGWYIKLPNSQKISAEPTLSKGLVYYPIFEPSESINRCSIGLAMVCAVDDECGTNVSTQLNGNNSLESQTVNGKEYAGKTCKAVGQGVLSRLVVFGNKLFANIAGQSTQDKTDLVVIDSGMGDVDSFRSAWREGNF